MESTFKDTTSFDLCGIPVRTAERVACVSYFTAKETEPQREDVTARLTKLGLRCRPVLSTPVTFKNSPSSIRLRAGCLPAPRPWGVCAVGAEAFELETDLF